MVCLVADVCLISGKCCQRCPNSLLGMIRYWVLNCTIKILSTGSDRSQQTVQTQIRLLLKEQSHCLIGVYTFWHSFLHLLNKVACCLVEPHCSRCIFGGISHILTFPQNLGLGRGVWGGGKWLNAQTAHSSIGAGTRKMALRFLPMEYGHAFFAS